MKQPSIRASGSLVRRWEGTARRGWFPRRFPWLGTIRLWIRRYSQRLALGDLADHNDYLLRDIGLARSEARREAEKVFWRQ